MAGLSDARTVRQPYNIPDCLNHKFLYLFAIIEILGLARELLMNPQRQVAAGNSGNKK
jgi:hypothetical protein